MVAQYAGKPMEKSTKYPLTIVRPIDQDNTMNEKLSVAELEELIFKIDLMLINPSELFTTPEQD